MPSSIQSLIPESQENTELTESDSTFIAALVELSRKCYIKFAEKSICFTKKA